MHDQSSSISESAGTAESADRELQEVIQFITSVRERVGTVVVGQDVVVERLLITLFTGGHLLLQGRSRAGQNSARFRFVQDD